MAGPARLMLRIDNLDRLPDGGPVTCTVLGGRGADIGRGQYLDWCLPDPDRYISDRHCEIRYENGRYLLYDISTNGTFVNGSDRRMQSPHILRTGDRLLIGRYLIAVEIEGEPVPGVGPAPQAAAGAIHWDTDEGAAPPIDPRSLRPEAVSRRAGGDFLETAAEIGGAVFEKGAPEEAMARQPARAAELDWAPVMPAAVPETAPSFEKPSPRRSAPQGAAMWEDPPLAAERLDADEAWAIPAAPEPAAPSPPPAPARSETPRAEPEPAREARDPASAPALLREFAEAAGLASDTFADRDASEVAKLLGSFMRMVARDMMQLLSARADAKRLSRSANQTVIQAMNNNPLKFLPTPDEALRIMLGPATGSYMPLAKAFEDGFRDLKLHHIHTYAAMQAAIGRLLAEFDPQKIDDETPAETGLSSVVTSRRARLWDSYVTRWKAMADSRGQGLADVFMLHFADCYDEMTSGRAMDGKR